MPTAKKSKAKTATTLQLNRYFIEVQTALFDAPRSAETALRRAQAQRFIADLQDWLQREALADKVSALAVTALGQVQIICEAEIISQLRHHDEMNIATIRHAAAVMETLDRFAVPR